VGKWHLKSRPTGFDYYDVLIGQGNYYNRLEKAFGQRLVPSKDIEYTHDNMRCSTSSRSGGYIVPILLEVNAE